MRLQPRMFVLMAVWTLFAVSCTDREASNPGLDESADTAPAEAVAAAGQNADSELQALALAFRRANAPDTADLVGTWTLVRSLSHLVPAEPVARFDAQGLRRDTAGQSRVEWQISFAVDQQRQVGVTSDAIWGSSMIPMPVEFSADEIVFSVDYGGDSNWTYRCRAQGRLRLVCLLQGEENKHGLEFRKLGSDVAR